MERSEKRGDGRGCGDDQGQTDRRAIQEEETRPHPV